MAARALRRTSIDTLDDACVDFAQPARYAFRKNPTVTECLECLLTYDRTFQRTLTRADAGPHLRPAVSVVTKRIPRRGGDLSIGLRAWAKFHPDSRM